MKKFDATGFKNNKATTNDKENSQHIVTIDEAKVNVFFDGTLNNYFNVNADAATKAQNAGSESYENELSNVALMWESISKKKPLNAVYIEGIGTERHKADSGLALRLALKRLSQKSLIS
jgi:hypothetical protein